MRDLELILNGAEAEGRIKRRIRFVGMSSRP